MCLIVWNSMDNVTFVPRNKAPHPLIHGLFNHPLISPVFWGVTFLISAMLLLWSILGLLVPSIPHGLILGAFIVAGGLTYQIERRIYPQMHRGTNKGWMPSLQRTWLSLGTIIAYLLCFYLFWWNRVVGVGAFIVILIYTWKYFPRRARRQYPWTALAELLRSQERIQAPGIQYIERMCLMLCLFWNMLGGLALIDKGILRDYRQYPVKILGKDVHSGGRGGPTYSTLLAGWPTPQGKLTQTITRAQYDRLTPGQNYLLLTRRSLFGTERLRAFKKP